MNKPLNEIFTENAVHQLMHVACAAAIDSKLTDNRDELIVAMGRASTAAWDSNATESEGVAALAEVLFCTLALAVSHYPTLPDEFAKKMTKQIDRTVNIA